MSSRVSGTTLFVRNLPPTSPIDSTLAILSTLLPGIKALRPIPKGKLQRPLPPGHLHSTSGHLIIDDTTYSNAPSWAPIREALQGPSADSKDPHCVVFFQETAPPLYLRPAKPRPQSRHRVRLIPIKRAPPAPKPKASSKQPPRPKHHNSSIPHPQREPPPQAPSGELLTAIKDLKSEICDLRKEVSDLRDSERKMQRAVDKVARWVKFLDAHSEALHRNMLSISPPLRKRDFWPGFLHHAHEACCAPHPNFAPNSFTWPRTLFELYKVPPSKASAPAENSTSPMRSRTPLPSSLPAQTPRSFVEQVQLKRDRSETKSPRRDAPDILANSKFSSPKVEDPT